jgi:outer membrane protein OmpA-like peptidoglycan-associated protein
MIEDVLLPTEAHLAAYQRLMNDEALRSSVEARIAASSDVSDTAAERGAVAPQASLSAEQEAMVRAELASQALIEVDAQQAAEAEAQAAADAQAAEEAAAAEAQAAEEAAAAEAQAAEDAAAAEAQAAEDAAAAEAQAAEDAAAAEAQAAEDAAAAEAQAAEDAAAAEAQAAEEAAAAEAQAQAEAEAEAEAEAQAAAEAAEAEAAQQAEAEAQAQAEAEAQAAADAQAAEEAAAAEAERAQILQERGAAAAAASADTDSAAEANVVTEQVTEESVRASDQEFETEVTGDAAAQTESQTTAQTNDDNDGMSDLEKALLLGLGAAVVGSVLSSGERVVSNSGDRIVVEDPNGDLRVLKDDDALIRRPGDEVRTETFDDGSSRTIVTKPDGSKVITVRAADGYVLRRINVDPQGREYVLFDDTVQAEAVAVNELPQVEERSAQLSTANEAALRAALQAELDATQNRTFSLRQVREILEVRALAPELVLDAIQFRTGSAAIPPEQARSLVEIGTTLREQIRKDPRTVILVEGHTDAVGDASYNLALSDRRAETVALALTEYFDVPPENLVTQGYGESQLKIPTSGPEQANRRAVVRNITNLLR